LARNYLMHLKKTSVLIQGVCSVLNR
jgi:hypothetical protein